MTAAALLLATALLVTPAPARHRLRIVVEAPTPGRGLRWCAGGSAVLGASVLLEPTVVLAGAVVVVTVVLRRRSVSRRAVGIAESAGLRDALDIVVGELRVGAHPVAALGAAAGEVDVPVGSKLLAVAARGRLGADFAAGFRSVADDSASPEHWQRMAVCWRLAQAHGLAIATLMRAVQHDIVERDRFRVRLDAGLAGARATAAVLAGMPVLGIAMGQLIGAEPVRFLLSGGGAVVLLVGVTLSCAGLFWSDRIIAGVST
ncbi:type II secretion system F family protein [Mycobacterium sp. C31M]